MALPASKKRSTYTLLVTSLILLNLVIFSFFADTFVASLMKDIASPLLDTICGYITTFEVIVVILFILPSIYLVFKHRIKEAIFLWLALIYSFLITFILKLITLRGRPDDAFNPWGELSTSFPSMHTAIVVAAAYICAKLMPKAAWLFYLYAGIVALSRIYFSFHYFSDIVTGSIVGFGAGWFLLNISKDNFHA